MAGEQTLRFIEKMYVNKPEMAIRKSEFFALQMRMNILRLFILGITVCIKELLKGFKLLNYMLIKLT